MNWFVQCVIGATVALGSFVPVGLIINSLTAFLWVFMFLGGSLIITLAAPKETEEE